MNDLYTGLINQRLRKGQNGEQFWGKYDALDNPGPPETNFLAIQIRSLQILEQGNSKKYKAANDFLKTANLKLNTISTDVEDKVVNEVYNRIMELMNAGLRGSEANPYKKVATSGLSQSQIRQNASGPIEETILELTTLLKQVNVNKSLSTQIIDMLTRRLDSFDWREKTPHDYIMEKAKLAEALMAEKIGQDETLQAFVTGSWIDESGKQLIEDALVFDKESAHIPFNLGTLTFSIKTKDGISHRSAGSVGDFLSQLKALDGKTYSIQLSNPLYEALQQAAILAGQAKSGLSGQAILNKNARNSLSLEAVGFNPMALWNLYMDDLKNNKTHYFKDARKQNSTTLEALANYALSKNIAKTAITKNQVYLTEDGFVSASEWMKKTSKYLIFTKPVRSIDGEFLSKLRRYSFIEI